ncbi:uncharacterized protein YkwD [Oxalobacteraceae bacterium GrIS 1.11]
MKLSQPWNIAISALLAALLLSACGGGGSDSTAGNTTSTTSSATPPEAGSVMPDSALPVATGNTATDGFAWFNFRRHQLGLPQLTRNSLIDLAAQHHSDYQNLNNAVSHDEIAGKPGFTGLQLLNRLNSVGYFFAPSQGYIYGEVIAADSNNAGFSMAENLVTAIYHRFVIFEPMFKEGGAGAAASNSGYAYLTADFSANNGYGPGLGLGQFVNYPFADQVKIPTSFSSDQESPDPVPNQDLVGYPISVHADISGNLAVNTFSVRPHGGNILPVRLLVHASDPETPLSAAAIIPLAVLSPNTTYDVSFSGTIDSVAVNRNWSFTTR